MNELEARRLDRASSTPLYYQLTEIVKEQIESGVWRPGEALPSEPRLAERFGVSRVVVRQAFAILEDDHQIVRLPGRGTFVAEPKLAYRAGGLLRLLCDGSAGVEVKILDKSFVRPERNIREPLGGGQGEADIARLNALLLQQGAPLGLGYSFFRPRSVPWLLDAAVPGQLLDPAPAPPGEDIVLAHSQLAIEASRCQPFESEQLGIAVGSATFLVLCTEHVAHPGGDPLPLEIARFAYRADVLQFQLEVPAGPTGGLCRAPEPSENAGTGWA